MGPRSGPVWLGRASKRVSNEAVRACVAPSAMGSAAHAPWVSSIILSTAHEQLQRESNDDASVASHCQHHVTHQEHRLAILRSAAYAHATWS